MEQAIDRVLALRRHSPGGLRRTMSVSFGIHFGVVLVLFAVPRTWLISEKPQPVLMTISLGGSPGERSGGMNQAGARPVEQVAPPPKRPVPLPPATPPKSVVIAVSPKPPPKIPPKPADSSATTPAAARRPPTTGAQVTRGTAAAETGATGQGTGLTFGGGAGGAVVTLESDFCCKEYIEELLRRIKERWRSVQPDTGITVMLFEIRRDGSFTRPEVEKSSGSTMLDIASKAAFADLKLPPLPEQYKEEKLKIHLAFPYTR